MPQEIEPYQFFSPYLYRELNPIIYDPSREDQEQFVGPAVEVLFQGVTATFESFIGSFDLTTLARRHGNPRNIVDLNDWLEREIIHPRDLLVRTRFSYRSDSKHLLGKAQAHVAEFISLGQVGYLDTLDDMDYREFALKEDEEDDGVPISSNHHPVDIDERSIDVPIFYSLESLAAVSTRFVLRPPGWTRR